MNWSWFLVIGALLAQILNIKKRRICWVIWGVVDLGFFYESYRAGLIPQAVLWAIYFLMCCWGYWAWKKK